MSGKEILEYEKSLISRRATVPGEVVEEILLPARGYMSARVLHKGQVIRIIDVDGQQVPDVMLWDANNLKEPSSCMYTMLLNGKWKIGKGDTIFSKFCSKLATIVEDTSPGVHHFYGGFCSAEANCMRFGIEGTPNCRDNLISAMGKYGLTRYDLELDGCMSLFMNTVLRPDGSLSIEEPVDKAGDYIELRAEREIVVAISNCPQERGACNAYNLTPLKVVIYNPS